MWHRINKAQRGRVDERDRARRVRGLVMPLGVCVVRGRVLRAPGLGTAALREEVSRRIQAAGALNLGAVHTGNTKCCIRR